MKSATLKLFRVVLLVAMLLLISAVLVACGLFFGNGGGSTSSLTLKVGDGISSSNDKYVAVLGDEFSLSVTSGSNAPTTAIVWYVSENGGAKSVISGQTGATLKYTLTAYHEKAYVFSASTAGKESDGIAVYAEYAAVENVVIVADEPHRIVQEVLQQKKGEYSAVTLKVYWNKTYVNPSLTYSVKWYVAGELVSSNAAGNLTFTPDDDWDEKVIAVRVYYGDGESDYKAASITMNIYEAFAAVNKVELSLAAGETDATVIADALSSNAEYVQTNVNYDSINNKFVCQPVSIKATVYPEVGTNLAAKTVWSVRKANGTTTTEEGRVLTFTPEYGENVVIATIENVPSRHFVVVAMPLAEYTTHEEVIKNTFVWEGNVENHYVSDQHDLNMLTDYLISKHTTAINYNDVNAHKVYLAKAEWRDMSRPELSTALNANDTIDEAGQFIYGYGSLGSDYKMWISTESGDNYSTFGEPTTATPNPYTVTQKAAHTDFSTSTTVRSALPIDSATESPEEISSSNMLYRYVSWGYKPVFASSSAGTAAKNIYDKAREVLYDICDDNMTEYEKVRAIYQWIVTEVDYDYSLANMGGTEVSRLNYYGFYLEGVFANGATPRAVCDGKSKAFVLMCGMEGVRTQRLSGTATTNGSPGNHAWNRVLVDVPNAFGSYDGSREWYVVDTTWGDMGVNTNVGESKTDELLNMRYFLTTDASLTTHETERTDLPAATTVFDYYRVTSLNYADGEIATLYVTSDAELEKAMDWSYSKQQYVEIKVSKAYAQSAAALGTAIGRVDNKYLMLANVSGVITIDATQGIYMFITKKTSI